VILPSVAGYSLRSRDTRLSPRMGLPSVVWVWMGGLILAALVWVWLGVNIGGGAGL
jgi:hypothetical protein